MKLHRRGFGGFLAGSVTAIGFGFSLCSLSCAAMLNLSNAVVVTPAGLTHPEEKAVTMLIEEIQKRTLIRWNNSHSWPPGGTPVVAVGPAAMLTDFAGKHARELSGEQAPRGAEGYRIRIRRPAGAPAVFVIGNDARGVLFGVGHLLRSLRMSRGSILLPDNLDISTAPKYPLRGHQLGYRPKTNSYDGWTVPMWEQYIRDLAVFGTNAVELIPPRSDDAPDSPHFPLPQIDMMVEMSRICDNYGLDVWIWYPAMDEDYSDRATVEYALKEWGEVFRRLPRINAVFVPGGDPGHTRPKYLMALLAKETEILHRYHPQAQMWVSPQSFNSEWLSEFFQILRKEPDWLSGVVFGPQIRISLPELREKVPKKYPIRRYPDITHSCHCQYPVPDWDLAYALTEGREVINPRPLGEAQIFRRYQDYAIGFITYSEGCNDDVNKVIWSRLGWDPDAKVLDILRDYSRYFLGERYVEKEPRQKKQETGLIGIYFGGSGFSRPDEIDLLGSLENDWGNTRGSDWSGRWQGFIVGPFSGKVTFLAEATDGMRLKIGEQVVIDGLENAQARSRTILMEKGKKYPIRLEFVSLTGKAKLHLHWQWSRRKFVPIPRSALFYTDKDQRYAEDFIRGKEPPRYADDFAQALLALERNWQGPLLSNQGVFTTLQRVQSLEKSASPADLLNWRFQEVCYRVYYDAYIRSRLLYETALEEQAMAELRSAPRTGSLKAMSAAEGILDRAVTEPVSQDWRSRVFELAEALYQSIRMQLSVPRYKAIRVSRGANLDTIDLPLNNRLWLEDRFAELRKLPEEKERLRGIEEIVNWTNPGPGGFYDDLGNLMRQPHLVRGPGFAKDPAFLRSSLVLFDNREEEPISWYRHALALNDSALRMHYYGLDPEAKYKLRVVYTGKRVRLVADGNIEIHPLMEIPKPFRPLEFDIPAAATADGDLTLSWYREPGLGGNGRGNQVAEVWLVKKRD